MSESLKKGRGGIISIIAVNNQKGGVGKTTLTFNLSKGFAARGKKVLVIDNDPQGNLTSAFFENPLDLHSNIIDLYDGEKQIDPYKLDDNLFFIGADIHLAKIAERDFDIIFKLKEGLQTLKSDFDMILIDCLPAFGYLNMAALNAATHVLIPTKPSPFAMVGMKDLFDTVAKVQKRLNADLKVLGIILNLVEGRKTTIANELETVLRENYEFLIFDTRINKGVKLEESPSFNQSIMEYDPNGKISKQIDSLINEILERLQI